MIDIDRVSEHPIGSAVVALDDLPWRDVDRSTALRWLDELDDPSCYELTADELGYDPLGQLDDDPLDS